MYVRIETIRKADVVNLMINDGLLVQLSGNTFSEMLNCEDERRSANVLFKAAADAAKSTETTAASGSSKVKL